VQLDKLDLIKALAARIVGELERGVSDEAQRDKLFERRPIVKFVFERLLPVLNRPRPAGRRL
jgi:hypothetical protein